MIGVLVHGWEPQVYLIPDHVKQGVNVTVETLQRTLRAYEESGRQLPPTLYLQLDNTCKQNKSRFLMAYLGELVRSGVFVEVYVSFLPVGHTHEDIDQMFSRFAMAIRVHDTVTMEEMAQVFREAYVTTENMRPNVTIVRSVANVSDHVDAMTRSWANHGIAQYYQFHVYCRSDPFQPDTPPIPRVRGRQSTTGDEAFRGLFKVASQACADSTPIFDKPDQRIDWEAVGPSQRKAVTANTLQQFKNTIVKGHDQWELSQDQFDALEKMWDLLDSLDPINFHWLEQSPTLGYAIWPFKKAVPHLAQSSSPLLRLSGSDSDPHRAALEVLAKRGPGSLNLDNPWDPMQVQARNALDPWKGFSPGSIVLIQPPENDEESKFDGFWLGELLPDAPEAKSGEDRDPEDFFVGVHWWARKSQSVAAKLSWCDWKCRWEPQKNPLGLSIDAISIDTVGCEVTMNNDGTFAKNGLTLGYINHYRKQWFDMEAVDAWSCQIASKP